ncbi:Hypothetical protein, putative, partial [Bodo saltans]
MGCAASSPPVDDSTSSAAAARSQETTANAVVRRRAEKVQAAELAMNPDGVKACDPQQQQQLQRPMNELSALSFDDRHEPTGPPSVFFQPKAMSDVRDMNLIPIEDAHLASHSEEDARHSADDEAFQPREADVAPQLSEVDGGEQPQHATLTSLDAPRSTNHSHRTMISSKTFSTTITTTHNSLTRDGDDRSTPKSATNGPSGHGSSFHTTPDKRRSIDLSVATTTGGTNTATSSAQPPPPIQLFGVPHSPVHAGVGRGQLHQSTELLPGEMDGTPTTTTTFEGGGTQSRGSFRSLPSNTALMPTAGLFSVSPGANPGSMLEPPNSGRRQPTDSPGASTNTEDAGTTPQGFASSSRHQRSDNSSRNLRSALQASAEEEILTIQNQHRQLEGLVHMVRTGIAPTSSGSAGNGNRSNTRGGGGASMARSSTYPSSSQAASDPHNSSHIYNSSAHGDSLVFGTLSTAGGLHLAQTVQSLSSHASMDPPPSPAATRGTRKQRRSHHHHHHRDGSIVRSPMPPPYPPASPQQQPTHHRRQHSAQHNDSISEAPVVTPQNSSSGTQQQQQQSYNSVVPSPPPSMIPPSSPTTAVTIGMTPLLASSAVHVSPQQPAMAVFDVHHRNSSLGGSMLLSDAGSGAASTKKMDDVTTTPRPNPLAHSRLSEHISPTAASSSLPSGGILSSQQIVASAVLTAFHGTELIQGSESSMVFGQSLVGGGGGGGGGGAVRSSMESSQLPNSNTHNMSIYNAIQSSNVSENNRGGGA